MRKKTPTARQPRTTKAKIKGLSPRHAGNIKGGGKATGSGGGNVSAGWDLTSHRPAS
jgi:hypothetical protein